MDLVYIQCISVFVASHKRISLYTQYYYIYLVNITSILEAWHQFSQLFVFGFELVSDYLITALGVADCPFTPIVVIAFSL